MIFLSLEWTISTVGASAMYDTVRIADCSFIIIKNHLPLWGSIIDLPWLCMTIIIHRWITQPHSAELLLFWMYNQHYRAVSYMTLTPTALIVHQLCMTSIIHRWITQPQSTDWSVLQYLQFQETSSTVRAVWQNCRCNVCLLAAGRAISHSPLELIDCSFIIVKPAWKGRGG